MLRLGAQQIYRRSECKDCQPIAGLRDRFRARQWLQQFKGNSLSMSALRHMLSREDSVPGRLDTVTDDSALDQAAHLLGTGIWHVHEPEHVRQMEGKQSPGAGPAEGKPAPPPEPPKPAEVKLASPPQPRPVRLPQSPPVVPKLHWIEIELVNTEGKPVSGVEYVIRFADGSSQKGTLDSKGKARHEQIKPGKCKVTFPTLHGDDWSR